MPTKAERAEQSARDRILNVIEASVANRFLDGLCEGLRGQDPGRVGYELARRF